MARRTRQSALERLPQAGGVVVRVSEVARRPGHVSARVGRLSTPPLSTDRAASIGLVVGVEWTDELRARVAHEIELAKTRTRALRAACARPMSARQLELKLKRKNVNGPDARRIVQDLESKGVLNDAAFAHAAAASELSRKPAGKSLLINKLRAKGVDQTVALKAVGDVMAEREYDPATGALEFARRKARTLARLEPEKAQRRLYAALARRGFEADLCRSVVGRVLGSSGGETDD